MNNKDNELLLSMIMECDKNGESLFGDNSVLDVILSMNAGSFAIYSMCCGNKCPTYVVDMHGENGGAYKIEGGDALCSLDTVGRRLLALYYQQRRQKESQRCGAQLEPDR